MGSAPFLEGAVFVSLVSLTGLFILAKLDIFSNSFFGLQKKLADRSAVTVHFFWTFSAKISGRTVDFHYLFADLCSREIGEARIRNWCFNLLQFNRAISEPAQFAVVLPHFASFVFSVLPRALLQTGLQVLTRMLLLTPTVSQDTLLVAFSKKK